MSSKRDLSPEYLSSKRICQQSEDLDAFRHTPKDVMELIAFEVTPASSLRALALTCSRWARILRDLRIQAALKRKFARVGLPVSIPYLGPVHVPRLPNGWLHGSFSRVVSIDGAEVRIERTYDCNRLTGRSTDVKKIYETDYCMVVCEWDHGKKHGMCRKTVLPTGELMKEGQWVNGHARGIHKKIMRGFETTIIESKHVRGGRWIWSTVVSSGVLEEIMSPVPHRRSRVHIHALWPNGQPRAILTRTSEKYERGFKPVALYGLYRLYYQSGKQEFHAVFDNDDGRLLYARWTPENKKVCHEYDAKENTLTIRGENDFVFVRDPFLNYRCDWAHNLSIEVTHGEIISTRRSHVYYHDFFSNPDAVVA